MFSTTKLARTKNYVSEIINDDDEMMKNVKIKLAFVYKYFFFQKLEFQKNSKI